MCSNTGLTAAIKAHMMANQHRAVSIDELRDLAGIPPGESYRTRRNRNLAQLICILGAEGFLKREPASYRATPTIP